MKKGTSSKKGEKKFWIYLASNKDRQLLRNTILVSVSTKRYYILRKNITIQCESFQSKRYSIIFLQRTWADHLQKGIIPDGINTFQRWAKWKHDDHTHGQYELITTDASMYRTRLFFNCTPIFNAFRRYEFFWKEY